jgi:hypothetical protein
MTSDFAWEGGDLSPVGETVQKKAGAPHPCNPKAFVNTERVVKTCRTSRDSDGVSVDAARQHG